MCQAIFLGNERTIDAAKSILQQWSWDQVGIHNSYTYIGLNRLHPEIKWKCSVCAFLFSEKGIQTLVRFSKVPTTLNAISLSDLEVLEIQTQLIAP